MPNLPRKNIDPYRELGVARGASDAEIKKAHRALAKRFHPDAGGGEPLRFLAVQEAYSLLSDPLRRREWDARHSPSPVRANEPRKPRPRGADGRWTREQGTPSANRQRTASTRRQRPPEPARETDGDGSAREAAWGGSDRPAGTRSYRWSAENVPWWEDFAPRNGGAGSSGKSAETGAAGGRQGKSRPSKGSSAGAGPKSTAQEQPWTGTRSGTPSPDPQTAGSASQSQPPNEFDVYSRSSGAAWSSAARQYFRKASEDLPSRGAFVYRGTQVVTGATARKVAEDLLRQRPGVGPAPRQAFEPRDRRRAEPASRPGPTAPPAAGRPGPWSEPAAPVDPADGARSAQPGGLATAAVGGFGGLAVTLPALALGMLVLDPPLQPAFALLLLVLAAIAGALAATVWARIRT